jgi:hypothetical protein
MNTVVKILLLLSLSLVTGPVFQLNALAQTVLERGGNIFYQATGGSERQLTQTGKDFRLAISADGTEVVFARRVRDRDGVASDDPGSSELWTIELPNGSAKVLVTGKINVRGINFDFFSSPRFSPEKEFVYFEIPYSSTSTGIVRLTRATGETQFIASAITFIVLTSGQWKGNLVALQRQAIVAPDPTIELWYWLLDSNGERVAYVGKSEIELQRFLARSTN